MSSVSTPPGFAAALNVLEVGRAAFFGSVDADLPVALTPEVANDDKLPQFGFVGQRYEQARLLILAINPGNGPRNKRDARDATALEKAPRSKAGISGDTWPAPEPAARGLLTPDWSLTRGPLS